MTVSTRKNRWLLIAAIALATAACSAGPAPTAAPGATGAKTPAASGATSGSGSGTSGSACPLTAEQVSAIVGARVEAAGACTFFPPDDAPGTTPNAVYNNQMALACDPANRTELGYAEKVDGLGVDAYVQRDSAFGTQILVCRDRPFEVAVDMTVNLRSIPPDNFEDAFASALAVVKDARFEAAKKLAQLVLAAK